MSDNKLVEVPPDKVWIRDDSRYSGTWHHTRYEPNHYLIPYVRESTVEAQLAEKDTEIERLTAELQAIHNWELGLEAARDKPVSKESNVR